MKTFYVALCRWPNGSYGMPHSQDRHEVEGMGALHMWVVRASAKSHVVPLVVAHLAGQDVDVQTYIRGGAA